MDTIYSLVSEYVGKQAKSIYDFVVFQLIGNRADFVEVFVDAQKLGGSKAEYSVLQKNAESLLRLYIDSIKLSDTGVELINREHRETGYDTLTAAKMYEFGFSGIPGKRIWSDVKADSDLADKLQGDIAKIILSRV